MIARMKNIEQAPMIMVSAFISRLFVDAKGDPITMVITHALLMHTIASPVYLAIMYALVPAELLTITPLLFAESYL
eukprot:XP_001705476.1 Hypothetical protein GL50803_27399 [Giardia lamblia ATCC 50803]